MALRCVVVRGLAKEVEEELNKFLASYAKIHVHHMSQSETGDHITVTLVVDMPDPLAD
jgi:ribosomal protein S17